jgi:hypothetical protein
MGLLATTFCRFALLPALLGTPLLTVRHLAPRADALLTLAWTGVSAILLNAAVPIGLHLTAIPVTAAALAGVHWIVFALLLAALRPRRIRFWPRDGGGSLRIPFLYWAIFAVLVFPFTHLAGIDTYRWQSLATGVRVERMIPWLLHPVSLFGFGPRAYPSAQPLVLASVQILGGLGVDAGFYFVSLLSGAVGILTATLMAVRLLGPGAPASACAALYAFSPVFLRYNHWATGRGLFLAVLPLAVLCAARLPRWKPLFAYPLLALLLAFCHKTGIAAAVLLPAAAVAARMVPARPSRWAPVTLAVPFCILAVLASRPLAPAGRLAGCLYADVTRFGILTLAAAAVWAFRPDCMALPHRRLILCGLLLSFPLAHAADMYGAMVALPFLALTASEAVPLLDRAAPSRRVAAQACVAAAVLTAGAAVLVRRSLDATPRRIREAAAFLNERDPLGPFQIEAPGRARAQLVGYVSGCPRFRARPAGAVRVLFAPRPSASGPVAFRVKAWTDYLRACIELDSVDVEWYGNAGRTYFVRIDGAGEAPADARPIYDRQGVAILATGPEPVHPQPVRTDLSP